MPIRSKKLSGCCSPLYVWPEKHGTGFLLSFSGGKLYLMEEEKNLKKAKCGCKKAAEQGEKHAIEELKNL